MISPRIYLYKADKKYFDQRIKKFIASASASASDANSLLSCKWWIKSYGYDNEKLREPIVKVIEGLQDLQISRRRQTKLTTFFTNKKLVMKW